MRTLADIRGNLEHVGCDNQTALELCAEVERLTNEVRSLVNKLLASRHRDVQKSFAAEDATELAFEAWRQRDQSRAERDRLQAIMDIARKATQPGVAASVRHPYYLELVQKLWKGE